MRFAYADPPYLGCGQKHYGKLHPNAADYDLKSTHIQLIHYLTDKYQDGWVLSCNPKDLRWILPECPESVRVAAWTKTFHQIRVNVSTQYAWEPVIWNGGRNIVPRKPMIRDWHSSSITMRKGTPGAKPESFNEWILQLLGFKAEEDAIDDLFPGSNGLSQYIENIKNTPMLPFTSMEDNL